MFKFYKFYISLFVLAIVGCTKEPEILYPNETTTGSTTNAGPIDTSTQHRPTPYIVAVPLGLSSFPSQIDNPMTVEGVFLGRKLFYDNILSRDNTQSCASCHNQENGFTDNGKQFSIGITGAIGTRNSMPLFNLAWVEKFARTNHRFFWDGGALTLEHQVLGPIVNPLEMDNTLTNAIANLQQHPLYPNLFKKAFGTDSITTKLLTQAIAQFERSIVSGNTRFDKRIFLEDPTIPSSVYLTPQELRGMVIFNSEEKADCFHCHNVAGSLSSDLLFHHNGHQSTDIGLGGITNKAEDNGKFRTPTLRNLQLTAPYMHDGRFQTLEQVVEFYNSGAIRVFPADPLITKHPDGLHLTEAEKTDLVAFLKCMTDSSLVNNPIWAKP